MRNLLCTLACGLSMMVAPIAFAGDTSTLDILGFNQDGSIFAFEEYGIQDGSGFPYANRFYIQTADDKFVPGSPMRIRIDKVEGEDATLAVARNNVRAKGEAIIEDADLRQNAGFTAAYRALTQLDGNPHEMRFLPRAIFPPIDDSITVKLEEIAFDAQENCHGLAEKSAGFALTLQVEGKEIRTLHKDETIPESRSCPLGYSIQAVQTFHPERRDPVFAIIIAVEKLGFEGPDHRFIAVTGQL